MSEALWDDFVADQQAQPLEQCEYPPILDRMIALIDRVQHNGEFDQFIFGDFGDRQEVVECEELTQTPQGDALLGAYLRFNAKHNPDLQVLGAALSRKLAKLQSPGASMQIAIVCTETKDRIFHAIGYCDEEGVSNWHGFDATHATGPGIHFFCEAGSDD